MESGAGYLLGIMEGKEMFLTTKNDLFFILHLCVFLYSLEKSMAIVSTADIRQAYLTFFATRHGHSVIKGASLIPENDPTVLFTTAGMHPLVPYLLGEAHPSGNRLVDVQRCIRTQDIDEVGDASHLTFFEMLGNWSLGDYFKEGAIRMSYQFLTEVLQIPKEKLAVSCFSGDSDAPKDTESAAIWESLGVAPDRIAFLPKEKNWWGPAGKTGPCGPDTEMFYWTQDTDLPPPGSNPGTDEKNWLEIWNDVFMQYNRNEDGKFVLLSQQNVDTGMGLERTAQVMQGASSVYEIDVMRPIMGKVEAVSGVSSFDFAQDDTIPAQDDTIPAQNVAVRHARIIVDHLRAATFIIADGIHPSNVDQGYVLRKLIRRAVRSGKQLGVEGEFCTTIAQEVITQYGNFYTHLRKKQEDIESALRAEEEQFGRTLREGMKHFEKAVGRGDLDGTTVFHLYDTYGFPLELTKEMAAERGLGVDEKGFEKAFREHQEKSRAGAAQRFAGGLADHSAETTKLHTATHLLNAALRRVLGVHVQQKGSNITQERLRFDFNHDAKMSDEQIAEVEKLVNEAIREDLPVSYHLTTVEGAKEEGAVGVFDERYGDEVKVYVIGDGSFSKEICGGPHVARTGMIGKFKITKEESSSAGVRRVKAVVSGGAKEISVAGEIVSSSVHSHRAQL